MTQQLPYGILSLQEAIINNEVNEL